jgi:hypothetical protein
MGGTIRVGETQTTAFLVLGKRIKSETEDSKG